MGTRVLTLSDFVAAMRGTVDIRRKAVGAILAGESSSAPVTTAADGLERLLERLVSLAADVVADTSYETEELTRDILFLRHGSGPLLSRLASTIPNFDQQYTSVRSLVTDIGHCTLVSDRDGTVNNYCGRYSTSIQSAYNAVWLTRFARERTAGAVILTSAPLHNGGLVDIGTAPRGDFILAGSKGREFLHNDGSLHRLPLSVESSIALEQLNLGIEALTALPENRVFALIGSGIQFKTGQTTVCRQDVSHSVSARQSAGFLDAVTAVVNRVDPDSRLFEIEDTGLDIEIAVRDGARGGFGKKDGLAWLDREVPLRLASHPVLICGDTTSDLPMLDYALETGGHVASVFVTTSPSLRAGVLSRLPDAICVSSPDVLVAALGQG